SRGRCDTPPRRASAAAALPDPTIRFPAADTGEYLRKGLRFRRERRAPVKATPSESPARKPRQMRNRRRQKRQKELPSQNISKADLAIKHARKRGSHGTTTGQELRPQRFKLIFK